MSMEEALALKAKIEAERADPDSFHNAAFAGNRVRVAWDGSVRTIAIVLLRARVVGFEPEERDELPTAVFGFGNKVYAFTAWSECTPMEFLTTRGA